MARAGRAEGSEGVHAVRQIATHGEGRHAGEVESLVEECDVCEPLGVDQHPLLAPATEQGVNQSHQVLQLGRQPCPCRRNERLPLLGA